MSRFTPDRLRAEADAVEEDRHIWRSVGRMLAAMLRQAAEDAEARKQAEAERDAIKAKVAQVVQRWRREASEYPASETGAAYAQAAVRLCANELAAILKGEQ